MPLTDEFIKDLKAATSGFITPDTFHSLILILQQETDRYYYTTSSESNLQRMIFSLYDKNSFLADAVKYPHYISILTAIAFNSNYLTDVIVRNPEFLYWIVNPSVLKQVPTESYFMKDIKSALSGFRTFNARVNYLRLFKGRELLRIGVRDLLKESTLEQTTGQLSLLAKSINSSMFELCLSDTFEKYGITRVYKQYCLTALGKLGGNELNYSSDVDFILFFDRNRTFGNGIKKEYFELLSEAAQLFTQVSGQMTSRGYLYRVDFRLRPDGRNSPLCRTIKDYMRYYETRGEDWERQMLIKASFSGGSKKLFDEFYGYLLHYIYPSSFHTSPLVQIGKLKSIIEKNIGIEQNVKLFPGGIRDIEFSVQALQLLNGGRLPSVRTGHTLRAIEALRREELMNTDEAIVFREAYILYRNIEHYLQLMNDIQTHMIPEEGEMLIRMSAFLGFKSQSHFLKKLSHMRRAVRTIFNSIIGETEQAPVPVTAVIAFNESKRALDNYRFLETGKSLFEEKSFDRNTTDSFKRIEPYLRDFLTRSINPDAVLENLARIIKNTGFPSIWYGEFRDSTFLDAVLTLCQSAQKAIDLMIINKQLSDLLLTRKIFTEDISVNGLSAAAVQFILICRFTLGLDDHGRVSAALAAFIENRIILHSQPLNSKYKFFIMALGSFGSREMTFTSDADIIIVAEKAGTDFNIQNDFQYFLTELNKEIMPFEADCRLRPEGRSSQLVWDIENYIAYLDKRIQTWELQSLTRQRFISGSEELYNKLLAKTTVRITSSNISLLKRDILEMRNMVDKQTASTPQANFPGFFNVKKSRGGLIETEFLLQYLILSSPELFQSSLGKNTPEIISVLKEYSKAYYDLTDPIDSFNFYKTLELKVQILFNASQPVLPLDNNKRLLLAKEMGFSDRSGFEDVLNRHIKKNRLFFEKFLLKDEK